MIPKSHHNIIPPEDRDFFLLLRAGLWQRVEEPLSEAPDWAYIYKLACEQTVQGIVADGIGLYHAAYERGDFGTTPFPSGEGWEEAFSLFLDQSALIIKQNYKVNQMQTKVCQLLNQKLIPSLFMGDQRGSSAPFPPGEGRGEAFFVVKGQEAARNYPHPMLRCSGDIDLFVLPADYQRAQAILAQAAGSADHENKVLVDTSFFFSTGSAGDQIEVELHATLHPNLGDRIDRVLDQLQEELFHPYQTASNHIEQHQTTSNNIKPSQTLSFSTYCAVYYFLHCLQHFHWSGLGIRQITDWCMHLSALYQDCVTPSHLSNLSNPSNLSNSSNHLKPSQTLQTIQHAITDMGVQTEWNHFLAFCYGFLGMPKEIHETCNQKPETKTPSSNFHSGEGLVDRESLLLWLACKATGNMGHHKEETDLTGNFIARNYNRFKADILKYRRTKDISPQISLNMLHDSIREYLKLIIE